MRLQDRDAGRLQPIRSYRSRSFYTTGLGPIGYLCTLSNHVAGILGVLESITVVGSAAAAGLLYAGRLVAAAPAGGTALVVTRDRSDDLAPACIALGATASDGGIATPIIPAAGTVLFESLKTRDSYPLQEMIPGRSIALLPGEIITVQFTMAVGGQCAINLVWTERPV